ncbi:MULTISPECIES: bifunctional UDP-N-acetylglucosamine diphosphorylase/glucosamine-1-phosphate N-acetyltransferase GlmU [Chelativorans]|jgi:bifunctional UDP-N-acetylglucosamine pyrophosphorylase/glucosamine-1-phosphate N-acetyltransferase|uniref:Bifunctional protein GlmU n=1 Tax=Chelativorans sp. (strain BNC1) TaxID=266779 RepID=GLMU_CHESB|nr:MULTISPECIES: bifunctional UDP-N-acetylglucosamine diphosphorylase/glucosamine-1-phosphate N-acetyltransferase GlmU [Chelativorans]Q11HG1.1 RecName: Full=Bifunctional protein GlmU; Includes: RecName: Full=UDP-N-acetylglucosamine pyrophosphorylase; AltName: Full=N-acetylglucosamine-1-phosphate uridyltransferase; Includes: RecName: Full=Glucosamine-1-phosphate N-acetyltransferase [Chelativorans sp. BNC1]
MTNRTCLAVILAAGEGTRMKSTLPKVLHKIGGLEMVGHVMNAASSAGADALALVVGNGAEQVRAFAEKQTADRRDIFVQEERLGTAHAVLAAREAMSRGYDDVLVVFGDHPLLDPSVLLSAREKLAEGAAVAVLGFRPPVPTGYGRLIEKEGRLVAIREEKDCSEEERKITFCNSGVMAIAGKHALALIDQVKNENAKGEYYLTDIVEIANRQGLLVVASEAGRESAVGINNRAELAEAEAVWQQKRRRELMLSGVTLIAPETVFLSYDTQIGPDTVIEPNVWFGPGVRIASGAHIHAFSHIEEAVVETGATVGPFARLRPGAQVQEKAKIGNFCEIKNARIEPGAKVPHLSYIGDATVGAGANIGAGTITCNYDGFLKHHTEIGAGAFIGTNSALVAPVTIGAGAYVASGSVLTEDVPADALAFGRARQATYEGRGKVLRDKLAEEKAKKSGG